MFNTSFENSKRALFREQKEDKHPTDEIFSGFRAKFQKIVTCVAFSIKFAKTNQKFAENSEFCENYSLFFKIIHFTP